VSDPAYQKPNMASPGGVNLPQTLSGNFAFDSCEALIPSDEWIRLLALCSVIPNKILSELCERIMLRGFDSGLTLPSRY
jgi:hypothetical protein